MGSCFRKQLGSQVQEGDTEKDHNVEPLERKSRVSTEDCGEEVEEGAVYNVTLKKVEIVQPANKGVKWLEVEEAKLPEEFTISQCVTSKTRQIKAGTLEKVVDDMITSLTTNAFSDVSIFLAGYRAFASTKEVLDLLLDRYEKLESSNSDEDGTQNSAETKTALRHAIASFLRAWLDQCPDDFQEPPHYPCLIKVLDYLKQFMPGSEPLRKAEHLLEQLQKQEQLKDSSYIVGPPVPNIYFPDEITSIDGSEDFSIFREDIVAEQLTYMDAMLFKRVVPHHCLGCIWSQKDKKENKDLAPTIRATIAQFNAVTNCVIKTILKDRNLKRHQRAKIIEKWINIAHDCRILKNFSSLRAIVAALQSNSVYRLKKTWAHVAKNSLSMLEELSEIFSDEDNHMACRELLMKEGTSKFANLDSSVKANRKRIQWRLQLQKSLGVMQGTIPYLGIFLTDLMMLNTAVPDYVEGGLINFEKRRREFEIIAQIKLLQSSCNSCYLTSDRRFIHWFKKQQYLTEKESYALSCEAEPPVKRKTMSPKPSRPQKSLAKRMNLWFLRSDVNLISPTKSDSSVSSDESKESDKSDRNPDEPQKELSKSSSSSSSLNSMEVSSSGVSSMSPLSSPASMDCEP